MHWYKRAQNYFVEMTQNVDVDNDNDIDMQFKKNISWTYNANGLQTCPNLICEHLYRLFQLIHIFYVYIHLLEGTQ